MRKWMVKYSHTASGMWVVLYKKKSGIKGLTFTEALDQALCFGWVDNLKRGLDDQKYAMRFVPRKNIHQWSDSNIKRLKRLIQTGEVTEKGFIKIDKSVLSNIT